MRNTSTNFEFKENLIAMVLLPCKLSFLNFFISKKMSDNNNTKVVPVNSEDVHQEMMMNEVNDKIDKAKTKSCLIALIGFLVGPPIIGFLANVTNLKTGFIITHIDKKSITNTNQILYVHTYVST